MDRTYAELIYMCFGIIGFFGGFSFIGFTLIRKNTLLDIEKSKIPIFSDNQCGGRMGNEMRLTMPLLRLTLYDDFIVLRYYKKIVLNYSDIDTIVIQKGLTNAGMKIVLSNHRLPFILIYSRNIQKVKEIIENQCKLKKSW